MCKSEIFAETLKIVSKETEISVEKILSACKDAETVDARHLLVRLLVDRGIYPAQIAVFIHKTERTVNYMITNFQLRAESRKILKINWDNIRKLMVNDRLTE